MSSRSRRHSTNLRPRKNPPRETTPKRLKEKLAKKVENENEK